MTKNTTKTNTSRVAQIFDDLDKYRNFCRDYGYRFDEAELYNQRSYIYRQFQKFAAGKSVKNQWEIDLARFKEQEATKVRA
jgi:hypothetical protein